MGSETDRDESSTVVFTLADQHGALAAVRLVHELGHLGLADRLDLVNIGSIWRLEIARPAVDRMEYLFEVEDHNGHRMTIADPENSNRAGGAFGDKSVIEFRGYVAPAWLDCEQIASDVSSFEVDSARFGVAVPVAVWSPLELDRREPAPLLIVHDGPEYARIGGLTQFLAASVASGTVPPLRAALLGPIDRNWWYAANDAYASALCDDVIAALEEAAPSTTRIAVGVSLGALALLHAHRTHPGTFDALFLQSGSYFTPQLDPQESGFSGYPAVTGFVAGLGASNGDPAPVPTVLTCGSAEENLANNEAMAHTLQRLGYDAELVVRRDAHNYVAWRDALDPHLSALIRHRAGVHAT